MLTFLLLEYMPVLEYGDGTVYASPSQHVCHMGGSGEVEERRTSLEFWQNLPRALTTSGFFLEQTMSSPARAKSKRQASMAVNMVMKVFMMTLVSRSLLDQFLRQSRQRCAEETWSDRGMVKVIYENARDTLPSFMDVAESCRRRARPWLPRRGDKDIGA